MSALPLRHQWREHVLFSTDERVDAFALAVVVALHAHMSADGVCSVGLRRLASLARVSVPTVRARVDALAAAGLLEVERAGRSRTTYRATFPADAAEGARPGCTEPAGPVCNPGDESVQPGRAECAAGLHTFPYPEITPAAGTRATSPARRRRPRSGRQVEPWERPPVDRAPPPVPTVHERADGTLWVAA